MKPSIERHDGLPNPGSSASLHWLLGWMAAHDGKKYELSEMFNNQHSRKHWQDGWLARKNGVTHEN